MTSIGVIEPRRGSAPISDLHLYGALFAFSVTAFFTAQLMGPRFGLASDVVAIAGNATCGWSWLLVRALFQKPREQRVAWPLMLVLAMAAAYAFVRLSGDDPTPVTRMIENFGVLASSTVLLLAAIEPLVGLNRTMPRPERRFRFVFTAGNASIMAVAIIWVNGAPEGSLAARWDLAIKCACAVVALCGMAAAVWYRDRRPMSARGAGSAADLRGLGERLGRLITDEGLHTQAGLKIGDVAKRLGEPEHRVTQAVTGALGFRNFNALINDRRIAEAKRRLANPAMDRLPILTVAYDCGFGSIGPFNRAFKAATGVTPQQYRRAAKAGRAGTDFPAASTSPKTQA